MAVHEGAAQLSKAMKELLQAWSEAQQSWRDPVSQSFEQRYLVPLEADARKATEALGAMAGLLDQVRRDCT